MTDTYWNNKGKFEKENKRIRDYIPAMGKAYEPEAEAVRLNANLYYDWYNNGGWNYDRDDWAKLSMACKDAGIVLQKADVEIIKRLWMKAQRLSDNGGDLTYSDELDITEALERVTDDIIKQAFDKMKERGLVF